MTQDRQYLSCFLFLFLFLVYYDILHCIALMRDKAMRGMRYLDLDQTRPDQTRPDQTNAWVMRNSNISRLLPCLLRYFLAFNPPYKL